MPKTPHRRTDLNALPERQPLEIALKKIRQARAKLPELYAADLSASTQPDDFARVLADYGVLIREAKKCLERVPAFVAWLHETKPHSQQVVLTAHDHRVLGLVIDACNEENHHTGPQLRPTETSGATHKYEFVTDTGFEPVYPACLRAFGLLNEGHRVAAGLPSV